MYLYKSGNTPPIYKQIYTLKSINKYTTRSKDILMQVQNLTSAIAGHTYGINLLPQIMTY